MRNSTVLLSAIIILTLTLSCEKNDNDIDKEIKDGFSLIINDSITYNSNSIDFYDFSSHLIYLKLGNVFSFSNHGTFKVQVDNEEIYTGQMFPMYSSYMPTGAYIRCAPTFYDDYIIQIGFSQIVDKEGDSNEDPRNDTRIIEALKKHNQFKEGLSSKIISIQKITENQIKITIELTNQESENILYLDPNKMGLDLFHYFTNGLIIIDSQYNSYTHKLTTQEPEPWDSWSTNWLSLISGNETKTISIVYNDFDFLPTGDYTALFNYPGLSHQIEKEELQQANGRIWLGELNNIKMIDIE
jgi:hypothetical protein